MVQLAPRPGAPAPVHSWDRFCSCPRLAERTATRTSGSSRQCTLQVSEGRKGAARSGLEARRRSGEGGDENEVLARHDGARVQETWLGNVVGHLSLGTGRKVPSPHAWLMLRSEKLVALLMVLPTPSSS